MPIDSAIELPLWTIGWYGGFSQQIAYLLAFIRCFGNNQTVSVLTIMAIFLKQDKTAQKYRQILL
jgi:hypothetical protein